MADIADLRESFEKMKKVLGELEGSLDLPSKVSRMKEIENLMSAQNFWDDPEKAQVLVSELSSLKKTVGEIESLKTQVEDQIGMLGLIEEDFDQILLDEVVTEQEYISRAVRNFEIITLMSGENEHRNVLFSIHAGAGGTEACDWAEMLFRMYIRWFDLHGYKYERIQYLPGDGAGIKNVTLEVTGFYPYGHLRSEAGVHRLVRISPFDSNARRHTSFASIDVIPIFDVVEVQIDEKDLKIDTYRAGGPGGQHVNKTESAVRLTHIPTGIVVQCQNQRSQSKNREIAMRELISRIQRYTEAQRDEELKSLLGEKGEIAWGHQIRSYVMQPYTLVKDHRTDHEVGDVRRVLDGGLDEFIEAYLRYRLSKNQ